MNKILMSNLIRKRKTLPKPESRKNLKQESHLASQYLELKNGGGENEYADGEEEEEDNNDNQSYLSSNNNEMKLEPHEYAVSSDENDGIMGNGGFPGSKKDSKKNLKIAIPSVNYKYVKDLMFPDSKVKNEGFPQSPFPTNEYGTFLLAK